MQPSSCADGNGFLWFPTGMSDVRRVPYVLRRLLTLDPVAEADSIRTVLDILDDFYALGLAPRAAEHRDVCARMREALNTALRLSRKRSAP